jgi:flagellar protein FliO/FliZ
MDYNLSGYFMGLALLFAMLGLFWLGARYLKNKGALRFYGLNAGLRVESRLPLGPKKNLLVVKYRDKRLLLGVTEQRITLLDSEAADAEEGAEESSAPESAASAFRKLLHGAASKAGPDRQGQEHENSGKD